MATDKLLTIGQVAAALHLSTARVHQLLSEGLLEDVPLPSGRRRHAPGSPRISAADTEQLRLERQVAARVALEDRSRGRASRSAQISDSSSAPRGLDIEAARSAAMELKVRLDSAREQIQHERQRADRLVEVAAQLIDLLRDSSRSADRLDEVTEGYSSALTQLLTPGVTPD